jgi:hypothetical protein
VWEWHGYGTDGITAQQSFAIFHDALHVLDRRCMLRGGLGKGKEDIT